MTERRAFTLLEVTVVLAVVALAARLLLPRLADLEAAALDGAAQRLADAVAFGRARALLTGAPVRLVLHEHDVVVGRPAPQGVLEQRRVVLPARVGAVTVGGLPVHVPATVDLAPEGDALPVRVELVDARGRTAQVVIPPGNARAHIARTGARP